MGSFVIDILAMTFGMPKALFPALSLTRLRRRRGRASAFSMRRWRRGRWWPRSPTGWLTRARRLGRIVVVAVADLGHGIA